MSLSWIWTSTPAALGVAAAVGLVSIPGSGGGDAASAVPTQSAVAADWGQGWGGQSIDGGIGGWNTPGYDSGADATTLAQALSSAASSAVAEITPSVVNIDTVLDYGVAQAAGTGIVISSDGLVLTNHHVVEGATEITGTVVGTGTKFTATVLGYDPESDVAVIDLTGASGLPVAELGSSDDVRVGDLVVGVGNAGGVGGDPTAVEGQVTALGQTITATDQDGSNAETLNDLIGTNADIQAGQSGGPLVDAAGEVVGIDVAAASGYTGSSTSGYAIPIDDAKAVAEQIVSGQESGSIQIGATPFLGVELAATTPTGVDPGWGFSPGSGGGPLGRTTQEPTAQGSSNVSGVGIAGIVSGSAAEQAGLRAGDTVTAVNGTPVSTADQLSSAIAASVAGARVSIAWVDADASARTAQVTLGEGPVG